MMEVPKARGPGRSGPRRRTGCLTCRARKVRCDEAKPTCANCTRLRLQCLYKNVVIPGIGSRSSRVRSTSNATNDPEEVSELNFLRTVLRPNEHQIHSLPAQQPLRRRQHQQQNQQNQQNQQHQPHAILSPPSNSSRPDLSIPFDMLGFIGEITSDFQQKHLDLTNGSAIAPSPINEVDGGLFHDERQMTWAHGELDDVASLGESDSPRTTTTTTTTTATVGGGGEGPVWEERLLEHFRESDPPPTIFGPVDLEWRYVRDIMVAQSGNSRAVLLAIYCYSDIHKAWAEGTRWKVAPTYHQQANTEIQSCLLGEVSEPELKQAFTSVLLLMLAELIASDAWRPETSLLHSAYLLLQRFHRRTRLWTGFYHLVISWVSLLDVKSLVAGRDGDPLPELGNLPDTTPSPSSSPAPAPAPASTTTTTTTTATTTITTNASDPEKNPDTDKDDLLTQPSYLIYNAIVGPAFNFFFRTQQVIRRIVCIDLHHRTRGTVSDEFEVLQIAHQVGADLETLWNDRPTVLDVYDHPDALFDTLAPHLAINICRTFRQYVANFLALFVYLHRVAFSIYPRTDRVYRAVDQIIQLARVEARRHHQVPVSFVWPLFIAGLEGSMEQRAFIVQEMQRMASLGGTSPLTTATTTTGEVTPARHPNAGKALFLLEEMTRRQDASRTWADSKIVRRELFADFFVMI